MNDTEALVSQMAFACVNAPVRDGHSPIEIAAALVGEIADIFEDTTLGEELDLALVRAGFKQRPKYSTEYYTISESDFETID